MQQTYLRTWNLVTFDLGLVISLVISLAALVVSSISLYFSWIRLKRETPRIHVAVSKQSYKVSNPESGPTDKASLTIQVEVVTENKGNAVSSVTDAEMRIRYAYSVVTNPSVEGLLDKHVMSARPKNIEVLPFEVGEYGSRKTKFIFEFSDVYPRLLDRAVMPIDFRNPKKQDWGDFPILYQLTFVTSGGLVHHANLVFNETQEESQKVKGSIGMWEEWEMDKKFSPLEYYKKMK
jgi:hypothetical protein